MYDALRDGKTHSFQTYGVLKSVNSIGYILKQRSKVETYIVEYNGEILLIAPIRRVKNDEIAVVGSREAFDYVDFIWGKHEENVLRSAFMKLLKFWSDKGIKKIEWRFCDSDSCTMKFIPNSMKKEISEVKNVGIMLNYENYEEYLLTLSKSSRQNIRTAYNRITRDGHSIEFQFFRAKELQEEKNKSILKKCNHIYDLRQKVQYGNGKI